MGFDVRFEFACVLGHPGAAHQLSMLFKHPHIIGVDLVGAVASWIAEWLFGHCGGRSSRVPIGSRCVSWDWTSLRCLSTRTWIRVLDEGETIPLGSMVHWLFSSWWYRHEWLSRWTFSVSWVNRRHRHAVQWLLRYLADFQERARTTPRWGRRNGRFRDDDRFARLRRHLCALHRRHRFRVAPGLRPFTWEDMSVCVWWKRSQWYGFLVPLVP